MSLAARIAFAFLVASGAVSLVMLVPLPWSPFPIALAALTAAALTFVIGNRQPSTVNRQPTLIDLATLLTIIGYGFYATIARPWEWDFWAIWGLKGRVFYEARGIDWRWLASRWNDFSHPDYPPLLPLNYAFLAMLRGGWDDRWLGLLFVAYGAALLLIVRELAAREMPPLLASVLTLAVAGTALSRYVGIAEGPLIAFGTAGVLYARRREMMPAAILLGLAASTKNEGLTLLVAVAVALIADRRPRDVLRLWPALAIASPWLLLRAIHGLATDLAEGSPLTRAAQHVRDWQAVAGLLATHFPDPWLWLALIVALVAVARRERFAVTAIAVQALFFVAAYLVSPRDLAWHIETSWPRLVRQLEPVAIFAALAGLAAVLKRERLTVNG